MDLGELVIGLYAREFFEFLVKSIGMRRPIDQFYFPRMGPAYKQTNAHKIGCNVTLLYALTMRLRAAASPLS